MKDERQEPQTSPDAFLKHHRVQTVHFRGEINSPSGEPDTFLQHLLVPGFSKADLSFVVRTCGL